MTVTLITGANKGLGRETSRRLVELGHTVYLGARDPERGKAAAGDLGAEFVPLDVTDDASVSAAVAELTRREGRLDVLVNNAGVYEGLVAIDDVTADLMRTVYDVNVFGTVRMTRAFLPLLRASASPAIVNVSSGLGSFGFVTDPERGEFPFALPIYASSKAAVDMLTVQYAKGLPGIRVNAVEPGLTATDLHGLSGHGIQTVEEGAEAIVRLAVTGPDGPTGTFSDRTGTIVW